MRSLEGNTPVLCFDIAQGRALHLQGVDGHFFGYPARVESGGSIAMVFTRSFCVYFISISPLSGSSNHLFIGTNTENLSTLATPVLYRFSLKPRSNDRTPVLLSHIVGHVTPIKILGAGKTCFHTQFQTMITLHLLPAVYRNPDLAPELTMYCDCYWRADAGPLRNNSYLGAR